MATLAAARAALVAAVGATDEAVEPPSLMVFSNGSDMTGTRDGLTLWRFRVMGYVGWKDNATASADLAALMSTTLTTLQALAGWSIESVGGDALRDLAGGTHLTADINLTTFVTFS